MNGGYGGPPRAVDLHDFVDCCTERDFVDTRAELDHNVGNIGAFDVNYWRAAARYAHARLVPVLQETRVLIQRATDLGSGFGMMPIRIRLWSWVARLFRATSSHDPDLPDWFLATMPEEPLRNMLVEYIVTRWVRALVNRCLVVAIRLALSGQPELESLARPVTQRRYSEEVISFP